MKNPEEDILKRFLQDTFSDYEPEPNDLTWENIRKEIQPQQPNVGSGFKQWIVPVVALLLMIGGIVLNGGNTENKTELAINSTKENTSITIQSDASRPFEGRLAYVDKDEKSEKIFVNKTASKAESTVISKIEKSSGLPTFSAFLTESMAKPIVEEYSATTEEYVVMDDKLNNLNIQQSIQPENTIQNTVQIEALNQNNSDLNNSIDVKNIEVSVASNTENQNVKNQLIALGKKNTKHNSKAIIQTEKSSAVVNVPTDQSLENTTNHTPIIEAVIEEIRYIKPLETLKNKDFVLVKNELRLPQINEININREAKPVRRPVYVSVGITPLQTYRILTINNKNIQNLQTNNLFDSERNGWAFELGITKPIGNKWNLRSSISYLKMRQWAEYQVNTEKISVKNSNNYSNNAAIGSNDNEFIGQTRIEAKNLQMVGLTADVQRFFKITGRNRYFISGGSQLMVEPSEKQTNIFINASAGFQHLVNKDCFLTIEPTASYLLNNINDSKSLIQTNAYNLGLKVGLNFRVK